MSSSATISNDSQNGDCVQQPSSNTSGVPVTPSNTRASGTHQGNKKRSRGSTSLARADGQPSSSVANIANPKRSRVTTPTGRRQGSRNRSCRNTSLTRTTERPGSSSATEAVESGIGLETADREDVRVTEGDLTPAERDISNILLLLPRIVQQPSSNTSGVPVGPSNTRTSGTHQGNRKRSCGSTSLARADGKPSSSVANGNPKRSRVTTPTGRRQGSRSISCRNTSLERTCEGPGSSLATEAVEPGISSETADREDSRVLEGDLTPEDRDISNILLPDLGRHPSVYAREGRNPPPKGLSFRGAWNSAVELYREANDQYKELFAAAGFGDFLMIEPLELPQGYIIALTERWFAETNTLHLPCCEIGPTPVDWTMITGLHFGGECIKLNLEYKKEKVLQLLGLEGKEIFKGNRINLNAIAPDPEEVKAVPPTRKAKEEMFRRLFLYVIGSCFFGNNQSVINHEFLEFLEDVDRVNKYDWGAITYAAFLSGIRRKASGKIGSFTAFWQFLPLWAFEYLSIFRPNHIEDVDVFPRAMRWKFPENGGTLDNSELTASRCQLDYVDDESKVTWQPYVDSEHYRLGTINSSIALAKNRVRFMGIDTWQCYLGERCRRQLGLPCLVPKNPPNTMQGALTKKIPPNINIGISAETFVRNDIVEYASWFQNNSIGKIVDVTRLIAGTDIGVKVIDHWMAKHRPGMILVPKSEVEGLTEALDTADAKRKKLREELSRVKKG